MNIQELISLVPICSKYNKELIISLLGGDEATSEKIVATNIPPYDKVYILFNLAFLTAEQIKWLSLEFAKHACKYQFDENNVGNLSNYKTGTYEYNAILAIIKALDDDINTNISVAMFVYLLEDKFYNVESIWQLERIKECL